MYMKQSGMRDNPDHTENAASLRRIEGQVRGIQKMIADGRYCIDILDQIYAVRAALGRVEEKILGKHFQHCVSGAVKGTDKKQRQRKLDEILELLRRSRKS